MTTMNPTKHEHRWRTSVHLDGCHYYHTGATCECGASMSITHERSPMADPYSYVWMESQMKLISRDEHGRFLKKEDRRWEEVECERCTELKNGAPTKSDLVVVRNDGTVEREEHREQPQEPEPDEEDEDV